MRYLSLMDLKFPSQSTWFLDFVSLWLGNCCVKLDINSIMSNLIIIICNCIGCCDDLWLEMSAGSIHESLNVIADYQKHFRLKEMAGRAFAEDVNER